MRSIQNRLGVPLLIYRWKMDFGSLSSIILGNFWSFPRFSVHRIRHHFFPSDYNLAAVQENAIYSTRRTQCATYMDVVPDCFHFRHSPGVRSPYATIGIIKSFSMIKPCLRYQAHRRNLFGGPWCCMKFYTNNPAGIQNPFVLSWRRYCVCVSKHGKAPAHNARFLSWVSCEDIPSCRYEGRSSVLVTSFVCGKT